MFKIKKLHTITVIFVIVILLIQTIIPINRVSAQYDDGEFRYSYTLPNQGGTIMITGYIGNKKDVVIPSEINGTKVTIIGGQGFSGKPIQSVTIPNTITSIEPGTFQGMEQLTSIEIPGSVKKIASAAFRDSQLTSLIINEGVESIGEQAFINNRITSVKIPESLTSLETGTFGHNQLTHVEIPNNIKSIGNGAFANNQLISIELGDSVETIEDRAFKSNQLTNVIIPNNVTSIGDQAFAYNQLTDVTIPKSVKNIGIQAFYNNNLTSLELLDVTSIGQSAFASNQLTSVTIAGSITDLKDRIFDQNQLTSVELPDTIKSIGVETFAFNQLTSIELPDSLVSIGKQAFWVNELSNVTIPKSVSSVGEQAFDNNNLTNVTFLNAETSIGSNAFRLNPSNLTLIGFDFSTAKDYAAQNGFNFMNGEGSVTFSQNGNSEWAQSYSTQIDVSGYDAAKPLQYVWSTSRNTPGSGWKDFSNGSTLTTPTVTGQYYLHIKGTGLLGNTFTYHSEAFLLDNTNPTPPVLSGPTIWQNSDVMVKIDHGEDVNSGVGRTEYRTNNGTWATYLGPITISTNGETKIDARTVDKAGNVSSTASTIVKVDQENPSLDITPNTTETTHDDVTLTVKGSDEHSGVYRIQDPDGNWHTEDQISYSVKDNGTYSFKIEDNVGNQATKEFTVSNIDKTISFEIPTITAMSNITLRAEPTTHTTDVPPITVKDWRDGTNDWRLDVSASRLKMANGDYELPTGSIKLKPLSEIHRVEETGSEPAIPMMGKTELDNGEVTIAETNNSRGEFELIFSEAALEFLVDPTTIKVNNPNGTTYETTITWKLVTGP